MEFSFSTLHLKTKYPEELGQLLSSLLDLGPNKDADDNILLENEALRLCLHEREVKDQSDATEIELKVESFDSLAEHHKKFQFLQYSLDAESLELGSIVESPEKGLATFYFKDFDSRRWILSSKLGS